MQAHIAVEGAHGDVAGVGHLHHQVGAEALAQVAEHFAHLGQALGEIVEILKILPVPAGAPPGRAAHQAAHLVARHCLV